MKKLKKVFAVLLTLAMVLGMSMTSFAADYTINISQLAAGTNVQYVQIVKQNPSSGWELTKKASDANIGMTVDEIEAVEDITLAGTINSGLADLDFSKLTSFDGNATANEDGNATISVSEPGLYAIKADTTENVVYSWMLAYVGVNETTANVTAKGATNQVTKTVSDEKTSVAAGDEVEYTVTVKYPYFAENVTNKSFTITDKLTNGTFVNKDDVNVTIPSGLGLSATNNYKGTDTLIIELDTNQYDSTKAGQDVEIKYVVKANDDISTTELLTNEIKSNIKQDKNDTTDPGDETKSKVELPTFKADVQKTDESGNLITSTAKFALYEVDSEGTVEAEIGGETVTLSLVDEKETVNGVASFEGLANATDKTYYVKETQAPEGYAIDPDYHKLEGASATIVGPSLVDGVMLTTYNKNTKTEYTSVGFGDGMNFHDTTLSSLPSTGGIGTTIFTIGGCAIMVIAAALFFASRRKSAK